MILAGIDEAGYGPILGPLSVACCAVRLPGNDAASLEQAAIPDLWKLLRRCVAKKRDRTGRKLHINDSKQVYSPAAGLGELERSVLAWCTAASGPCDCLDALVRQTAPRVVEEMARVAWYAGHEGETHPAQAGGPAVAISANALKDECRRQDISLLPPRASLLMEESFNRMTAATRNKSSVLFSLAAEQIDHLLKNHAAEGPLHIVCDRHGGRSHYGPLLRLMFEEWELTILEETEAHYLLRQGEKVARLSFMEKADAGCLPTAMASMIAKYLRERLMGRFNAFWRQHEPELKPTAGYWSDGLRFLEEIGPLRRRLRIEDERLIRQR